MKAFKLKYHPFSKCKYYKYKDEKNNDIYCLYSYNTPVLYIEKGATVMLKCAGYYSRTTTKQITWFIREILNICNPFSKDLLESGVNTLIYNSDKKIYTIVG